MREASLKMKMTMCEAEEKEMRPQFAVLGDWRHVKDS